MVDQYDPIKRFEPLWGGWYADELIGEGGYGRVYRMVHNSSAGAFYSACKYISIPKNEYEIANARAMGMDDEALYEYFEEMARQIIREIEIMYSLRGEENIVGYEDHMVLHEPNSLRWEIFIRMELLVPLGTYIRNNAITPEDVRRLGIEICNALEACDSYSIIHRDIKEDNVFLNGRGKFKLGDFGVARETAREGLIMSMRGTRAYIAPEVYGGKNYDKTVDYYSLGILLYKLLNRGRYPFLPPAPERFTADDTETAFLRRINGEKFPPPVDGDEALKDAVMMACEFDPSERFENAAAMRNALMYRGE